MSSTSLLVVDYPPDSECVWDDNTASLGAYHCHSLSKKNAAVADIHSRCLHRNEIDGHGFAVRKFVGNVCDPSKHIKHRRCGSGSDNSPFPASTSKVETSFGLSWYIVYHDLSQDFGESSTHKLGEKVVLHVCPAVRQSRRSKDLLLA